jgi:anti-anti-sigma regulatory factor
MTTALKTFNHEELIIDVMELEGVITVVWRGVSDSRNPGEQLQPYLTQLTDQLRGRKVTIDFRRFEFMNSSTVAPIIHFVKQLHENNIPATILYDPSIFWQRVNFLCMKTIAQTLNNIQVVGAA